MKAKILTFVRGLKNGTPPRFQSYLKSLTLLLVMLMSVNMWGQSTTYTSNVTFTAGTNGSTCKIKINNTEYDGMKLGGSKATGTITFKIPQGTTNIHIHTAGWNNDGASRTLNVSTNKGSFSNKTASTSISLTNDAGVSNNSPFTLSTPANASTSYYANLAISGVTEEATITCTTSAKRAVVWGVNTEAASTKTLSAIAVKTAPTKTKYTEGDFFDPTGLEITKTYSDKSTEDLAYSGHTGDFTFSPSISTALTTSNTSVTITVGGKTCTQQITVNAKVAANITLMEAGIPVSGPTGKYSGDEYELPKTVTHDCGDKTFVGWSTETVDSKTKPIADTYHEPGDKVILGVSNTFYAVFADGSGSGGASGSYEWDYPQSTSARAYGTEVVDGDWKFAGYAEANSTFLQLNDKKVAYVLTPECPANISSVVVTLSANAAVTMYFGSNKPTTSAYSSDVKKIETTSTNTYTIDCSSTNMKQGYIHPSATVKVTKVVVNYGGATSYSDYTTTCGAATDPKINASNVDLAYSATSGEIAYTIENATEATLSASSEAAWISNIQVAADKVTFDCTANTTQEARVATIKLSYEGATDKNITITQAAAPYSTIADLYTKAIEVGNTATPVSVKMTNWKVVANSGKNAYITDGTDGLTVYTDGHGFVANDQLNGTVECKVQLYNNGVELTELTTSKFGDGGITHDIEVSPIEVASIADLKKSQLGALIKLSNLTYNGSALSDGTNTITPYDKLYSDMSFTKNKKYNVTGVYIDYFQSGSFKYSEIMPRGADDIELITYAITINIVGNGTVTSSPANKACEGDEVALTIHPTTGYRLSSLSVTDADGGTVTVSENKFTMPAKAVTVSAEFAEIQKRDVTLHIGNGTTVISQVLDGTPFSEIKPAIDPAGDAAGDCANAFVGWATEAITGSTTEDKVAWVTASTIVAEGSTDFYAVFATASDGGKTESWEITKDNFDKVTTGSGYSPYNGTHTLEGFSYVSNQVMLQSSKIQFQSNAGLLYNTTSFGKITKIELTGSKLSVYDCAAETSTTPTSGAITESGSGPYTYSFSGNNGFFHIKGGSSTPTVTSIKVYYAGTTYSGYVTSCCTKHDVKLTNNGVATGGTFEANPAKACDGTDITLIATPATGYQFGAWSTDPTQTITENVFTMPDEDVTVSASFELQKHNVTLHKNDGVNPEATDVTEYTYGDTKNLKTLATLAWSVDGHIFAGWATSAAGKGEYEDGYAFKLEEENDVDLYATWVEESLRPVTYTSVEHLTYANTNPETVNKDAAGFVVAYTVDAHYQVTDAAVTVNGVALTSGITVGQSGLTIEKADGFDGPIVVTPVVAPIIYNVIWEANGEQFATNTVQQGSKPTLPAEEPTTCGETILFMGWTNAEYYDHTTPPTVLFNDAASAREVKAEDAVDGTITYYAVYAEVTSTPVAESTVYTSNISDITGKKVKIANTEYDAIQLGTSGTHVGTKNITVPAGTTTLTLHAASWNNSSDVTLTASTEATGVIITPSTAVSVVENTGLSSSSPWTITPDNTHEFFTFTLSGVKEATSIKFENNNEERVVIWGVNASTTITSDYSTTCLPALTAPTIITAEGEYCGSVDIEITQPAGNPDGAKIMYSTDNTNWNEYTAAVNITTSGTVYAKVVKDPKSTDVVSATYTVYPRYTLAQAATAATDASQIACLTFSDLLVQARSQSEAFLKASDGQIVLLNKSSHGLSVGDKLSATDAHLNFIKSHDLLQLTSMEGVEKPSTGNATTPEEKAITALVTADYGKLVKIMNVIYDATNKKFTDASSNEIAIDAKFFVGGSLPSWPDGGKFNATGIVLTNSDNVVIAPRNSEDLESLATPLDAPTDFAVTSVNSYRASYSWTAVDNNVGYTLYIYDGATEIYKSNKIGSTIETYAPTKDLEAGHTYTAKLVALGDKAEHSDSPAAEVEFTTNPNAQLNWYVDGEFYTSTDASQEKVVTPEDPESPCATNYENFVTWYTEEIVSETGQITALDAAKKVKAGDAAASQASSAKEYNFYAVFGKVKTPGTDKYVKVTEAQDNWKGEYLIGYDEGDDKDALTVFDGSLTTLDATSDYTTISFESDGSIAVNATNNGYNFKIEKSATEGYYTIQSASGIYIANTTNGNKLSESSTTAYKNTISWSERIDIATGENTTASHLSFNSDQNQMRFRYYTSNKNNIVLYKREKTNPQYSGYITTCPVTYTITIANNTKGLVEAATTTEILKGAKVQLTATANDGYTKTGGNWIVKNTATQDVVEGLVGPTNYLTMPAYDVTVDYNFQEIKDNFVDNLHGNTAIEKGGANYELPVLADFSETTGKPSDAFTKFVGWSATSYDSGEPATEKPTILEGNQTATGATYFAVWYNGSGKYITEYCQTSAPANLHLVAEYHKATSVRIDWNSVEGADKYHIIVMDGEAEIIADADVTESLYDLSGLTPGATYICTVKAHKDCWSDETEEFEFTTKENIQSYAVTINAEGGTYTIDPELVEGKIQEGKTVTISNIAVTDATTYFFKELTVPEATDLTEITGGYKFTMPGKAVTINIVFAEYPKVTWKMEGAADVVTSSVRQDNKFVVGTVQSAPATWSYKSHFTEFAGWVTSDKCDAEGNVTNAEFVSATTEVPVTGLIVYGAVATSASADMSNATKVTSNANLDMTAHYVIGTEKSNTPYFFSDYDNADEALNWGQVTMDVDEEAPLVFTLSGTTSELAIQDNRGNYLVTPTKNKTITMSTTKGTVGLDATGNIISGTSYYLRVNTNSNSEGIRWYDSKTCDQAYLYKVGLIYEKLTINPQPDYGRTDLVVGNYGTVCVPFDVKVADRSGATFWNIETSNAPRSTNPTSVTIVQEEGDLVAGKPYIFCATDTKMALFFSDDKYEGTESVDANGLYGNLTDGTITINPTEYEPGYFFVLQQKLYECGVNCTVGPNRGWVQAAAIEDETTPSPAPRRVIGNPNGTPTGINNLNTDGFMNIQGARKYFHNNQIMIVNEGRIYNAQGIKIQ